MRIFNAVALDNNLLRTLSADETSWIYNGLDSCVTFEIYERLMEELAFAGPDVQKTYSDVLALSAPFLEMSLRGLRVDERARQKSVALLQADLDNLDALFQRLVVGVFGSPLNWDSPTQLKDLFYRRLGLPEIKKRNAKGQYMPTVDEATLERLAHVLIAAPFANFVIALRNVRKQLGFLKTEIDPDGFFRCNINLAGTNTGRASSSASDFGSGSNLQNVDTRLRYPFIAGPQKILVNVDLEQADARNVGAIIHDLFYDSYGAAAAGAFLDACESGDLHTRVCSMAWSELPWTGDRKEDRAIADQPSGHGMSYRDLAKRLGHGTNYLGTPGTMAKHTHTAVPIISDFQKRYFAAFPLIKEWHKWVIKTVTEVGVLTTPFGRRRHFFGRGNDASTHRKAVAYSPQSMTGHEMNMGILKLFRNMPEAELMIQVHDSILFQVPFHRCETYIERAMELLRFEHELRGGRIFCVPLEAMVGWNWGKLERDKAGEIIANPNGIEKWRGAETRQPPEGRKLKDSL